MYLVAVHTVLTYAVSTGDHKSSNASCRRGYHQGLVDVLRPSRHVRFNMACGMQKCMYVSSGKNQASGYPFGILSHSGTCRQLQIACWSGPGSLTARLLSCISGTARIPPISYPCRLRPADRPVCKESHTFGTQPGSALMIDGA